MVNAHPRKHTEGTDKTIGQPNTADNNLAALPSAMCKMTMQCIAADFKPVSGLASAAAIRLPSFPVAFEWLSDLPLRGQCWTFTNFPNT